MDLDDLHQCMTPNSPVSDNYAQVFFFFFLILLFYQTQNKHYTCFH